MYQPRGSLCVGVMSGTSMDGIDVAIVDIQGDVPNLSLEVVHFATAGFPEDIRKLVFDLFRPETSSSQQVCEMNFLLGDLFADAILQTVERAGLDIRQIDFISSHGQTIYHSPETTIISGRSVTSTLQIGESAVIAEKTGCTVVSDFRVRDVAAGGQGAPLVPYVDALLFASNDEGRVAANIGGIANLTYLPPKNSEAEVLAFDTGPGNMIIDGLVRHLTDGRQRFDEGGKMAYSGRVVQALLDKWMGHPYILRQPPKTTGRELFGEQCVEDWLQDGHRLGVSAQDLVRTATEFTVRSFSDAVKRFVLRTHPVREVLVGGGGAYNPVMMNGIRRELPGQRVLPQDVTGVTSESKEAVAFAVLGYQCLRRRVNNVPSATGARHPVVMGKVTWP